MMPNCATCAVAIELRGELERLHKAAIDAAREAGHAVFEGRCDRCGVRGPVTVFDRSVVCASCRVVLTAKLNREQYR